VLGAPELDTVLQVGSHQCRVERQKPSLDLLAILLLMQARIQLAQEKFMEIAYLIPILHVSKIQTSVIEVNVGSCCFLSYHIF